MRSRSGVLSNKWRASRILPARLSCVIWRLEATVAGLLRLASRWGGEIREVELLMVERERRRGGEHTGGFLNRRQVVATNMAS